MKFIGLLYETDLVILSADFKPHYQISEISELQTDMNLKFNEFKDE